MLTCTARIGATGKKVEGSSDEYFHEKEEEPDLFVFMNPALVARHLDSGVKPADTDGV